MSERKRVIVAGVAELEGADPALAAAARLAERTGAELHLVHAYELPVLFRFVPGVGVALPETGDPYRGILLEQLHAAAREAGAGDAACHVVKGSPGACLLQVAESAGADLLVAGAARGSRLRRLVLGTTAQRVLREASVPVLVVRGPAETPVDRLLLATDMTEFSAAAQDAGLATVDWLLGEPRSVRALYVLPWSMVPPPVPETALEHSAALRLEEFLRDRAGGPAVEPHVRAGAPAEEIVAEARDWPADLVVVGTHARSWGARMLLGSVAEAALRDAPCNVLAVPPKRVGDGEPEAPTLSEWTEAVATP
jgi:nucleotide-binding universal stress UspA family protein